MRNLIITATALITLFLASCSTSGKQNTASADSASLHMAAVTYTCPMHPEIISDKPGKCSICKMNLVEKKENATAVDSTIHGNNQH